MSGFVMRECVGAALLPAPLHVLLPGFCTPQREGGGGYALARFEKRQTWLIAFQEALLALAH
jgi:hypothetical protein